MHAHPAVELVNQAGRASVAVDDPNVERTAVQRYNSDIAAACQAGDNTTRALLERILEEEDQQHLNELEGWLIEIDAIGLPSFLLLRGKA